MTEDEAVLIVAALRFAELYEPPVREMALSEEARMRLRRLQEKCVTAAEFVGGVAMSNRSISHELASQATDAFIDGDFAEQARLDTESERYAKMARDERAAIAGKNREHRCSCCNAPVGAGAICESWCPGRSTFRGWAFAR